MAVEQNIFTINNVYGVTSEEMLEIDDSSKYCIFPVHPSWGLKLQLHQLPEGSVVGLELPDPKDRKKLGGKVNGAPVLFSEESRPYWREIRKTCHMLGHQVVYLDDFASHKEVAAIAQAQQAITAQKGLYTGDMMPDLKEKFRSWYRYNVEAEKIHKILRGERILERMVRYHPTVAILSPGFAEYFIAKPEILKRHGLVFGSYAREKFNDNPVTTDLLCGSDGMPFLDPHLEEEAEIDPWVLLSRELLERRIRTVEKGRILADKIPDYIGTWDLDCPERGLFEVYKGKSFENNMFTAIIEDTLGTATAFGVDEGGVLKFVKEYQPERSSSHVMEGQIYYEAIKNDQGKCVGEFHSEDSGYSFPFILNQGSVLM